MTAAALLLLAALASTQPATAPTIPHRPVGQVLGKTVYLDELGIAEKIDPHIEFDARDQKLWEAMGRVSKAFGSPIIERFKKEQKVEATDEEKAAFARTMAARRAERIPEVQKEIEAAQAQLAEKDLAPARARETAQISSRRAETRPRSAHRGDGTEDGGLLHRPLEAPARLAPKIRRPDRLPAIRPRGARRHAAALRGG